MVSTEELQAMLLLIIHQAVCCTQKQILYTYLQLVDVHINVFKP
jgi:hypothetical protein